jgi:hypothetical protein
MIRVHDTSTPQALPIATVKRTYSKNVVLDVLSGKKVHLVAFACSQRYEACLNYV